MGVDWRCKDCGTEGHNLRPPSTCPKCGGGNIWNEHHDEDWSAAPLSPSIGPEHGLFGWRYWLARLIWKHPSKVGPWPTPLTPTREHGDAR